MKTTSTVGARVKVTFVALAALLAANASLPAFASEMRHFDIKPSDAATVIREFATQSGVQILVASKVVGDKRLNAVSGEHSMDEALTLMLDGTGLKHRYMGERAVALVAEDSGRTSPREARPPTTTSGADTGMQTEQLEEIVVTAQKREERLQDVPVPVSVLSTSQLVSTNQLRLEDYYQRLPGLNLTMLGDVGSPLIAIRGITPGGYVTPTVGTVVDDIPFGSSTSLGNGVLAPDFDPSEFARIEVLRGPQGTLYGANSLGGLLKYVTLAPSTDAFKGRVQLGGSTVRGGDDLGYNARSSLNIPIDDTLAVRVSGTHRVEPGYVDNVATAQDDVNETKSSSYRVAARWRPNDVLAVSLSALRQETRRDASPDTHLLTGLGDLQQSALRNTGWFDQELDAYSASVVATLGAAEITSLTGYSVSQFSSLVDLTPSAFLANATQARFGVRGLGTRADLETRKVSQELRLSMPLGERIDLLGGVFYTKEEYESRTDILPIDPATGRSVDRWLRTTADGDYEEYAAFANLTFAITDRFDVQVGARAAKYEFNVGEQISVGPFPSVTGPSVTAITPLFDSADTPITYLLTPRWRFSDQLMLYARMASGYRPGGPNLNTAAVTAGFPAEYGHDSTRTYEIGAKGSALDRALLFDMSIYYIDWRDVQLQLRDPNNAALQYTVNGGTARSQGVELSLETHIWRGFTLSGWAAYNEAEITEIPLNSVLTANKGDRLPYSPRWSGNLSAEQTWPFSSVMEGFIGASFSYIGERQGRFFTGVPQGVFPKYTQLDLRTGVMLEDWNVTIYLNNVTDERGILRSGRDTPFSFGYAVTYTQPRVIGLSVSRDF